MPQVKRGTTVLVHYTITTKNGQVVETTAGGDPARITVGAGKLLPGIEEALEGMGPGESKRVTIPPEKAYGQRKAGRASRHSHDTTAPIGKSAAMYQQQVVNPGTPDEISLVVTDRGVNLDRNAYLAGQELMVDMDVVSIES